MLKAKGSRLTRRVQTVMTEEEYQLLRQIARQRRKTVSALIREAVVTECLEKERDKRRREALDRLLGLDAPVGDWEGMEAEIEKGAMDG